MTSDPVEWEFGVPASQVDIQRLCSELIGLPAIYVYSYIDQLKKNAPVVYGRFVEYARANGLNSYIGR
jgi:hypothetical protein